MLNNDTKHFGHSEGDVEALTAALVADPDVAVSFSHGVCCLFAAKYESGDPSFPCLYVWQPFALLA